MIAHLTTGARKGVIVEMINAKLDVPRAFLDTAITKGFNRATGLNLSTTEIKNKHFVNIYSNIKFHEDGEIFDLEYNMSEYSLGHKKSDYVFVQENISVAEIDSKNYERIVSIDFETASGKRESVCSIGFVVEENGQIIEEKEILVNPKMEFSKRCIDIHGIKPEDVENAPTWDMVWNEVEEFVTDTTLVIAHNIRSTELVCIRDCCTKYNMKVPKFAKLYSEMAYDTLKIAQENLPGICNHKLDTLCNLFGIELDHHNALSDAKACLELFHKLKEYDPVTNNLNLDLESVSKKEIKTKRNKNKFATNYKDILEPSVDAFDENHELYNKKVVFTGEFELISRKDASQKVLDFGGVLGTDSLTKDTNYLVVGKEAYRKIEHGEMSGKVKKALKHKDNGLEIKIISEEEFVQIAFEEVLECN